jgi:hypothetical protein
MAEEENLDEMLDVRVSGMNIERVKAIGKSGDTFNDVVTMLLDYYEELHCQDWVINGAVENKKEAKNKFNTKCHFT